jgi:anti-sigma-K factor RskA
MMHDDYKEMLAAGALSALDAADDRALASHLETCSDCRSEMHEWQDTASFMALSSPPLEPSADVRGRILESVHSESRTKSEVSRVIPFESPRKNIWTSLGSFGAIAAALAILALVVGLFVVWQQNRRTKAELVRLSNEMRDTNEKLATERALVALLSTPGAKMMELSGTNVAPGAHAMLAYDKTGHAMLMTKNLPAPPAGKAYQLWFIKDNQKMPGKVFTPDERGNGVMEDQIPASAMESAVYAITLEPRDGVKIPTGAIYLVSAS